MKSENKNNHFLETLINLTPGILYIYDIIEQREIYSSAGSLKEILGYSEEEISEPHPEFMFSLMHPDDFKIYTQKTLPAYADARDGEKLTKQLRMKHRDGGWRWFNITETIYMRLPDGTPKQIFGLMQDITEQKTSEIAQQESDQLLTMFLKHSPIYTFIKDISPTENRVLKASENYRDMIGIPGSQMIGKTMKELFPPDLAASIDADDRAVIASKEVFQVDEDLNGRHYTSYKFPITIGDKDLLAGYTIDITEQKEAEAKIATEKELLAVTLHSLAEGVITTDIHCNIVMMNQVAEELTGWCATDAIGSSLSDVYHIINEISGEQSINSATAVLETGNIIEQEYDLSLIRKGGKKIIISSSIAPIHDSNHNIIGVVLVFRDMTERQKLNDMEQRTQKLESLGVLAGGIAHDFNNIFAGIFGYIELARMKTTNQKINTYLEKSLKNIDRATALTRQLLTFARGGGPVKKTGALFPFIEKTAQFALSGSPISARFQIEEDLWLCSFDQNQIGQVIDHLTINALQAMPGGGSIHYSAENITLSEDHLSLGAGDYIKISIQDSGPGISKELLKNVFDPYFTTKSCGHGLGLTTCYSILRRHGGVIEVESELGQGTTVHLYLPAAIKAAATEPTPDHPKTAANRHRGRGTFLVMDDEVMIRNLIKKILELFGYTVILKKNGEEAIDCVERALHHGEIFSGMIFDLTIPGGMGGEEAIKEVRKHCPDIPVFVASGYANNPVMADPAQYGFTASIKKPFRIDELSEMLEQYMNV